MAAPATRPRRLATPATQRDSVNRRASPCIATSRHSLTSTARSHNGLDAAFDKPGVQKIDLVLRRDQIVFFSDLHKGDRGGADEFRRSERVYNAALAHYYAAGFRLAILGDAEELWKYTPEEVLSPDPRRGYRHTIELEAKFHRTAGHYIRVVGNHDECWRSPATVDQYLAPIFNEIAPNRERIAVHEAVKLGLRDLDGEERGQLWLTHGNQGDALSDKFAGLSHLLLRRLWRPLQASYFSWISSTQPAVDWELREQHDVAMHDWAQHRPERPILIAGHTHRPVLVNGKSAPDRTYVKVLADLDARRDDDPDRPALESELAETLRHDHASTHFDHPCYFNTGCGCLGDGDITAIEMTSGDDPELVLVRWSSPLERRELDKAPLQDVLDRVGGRIRESTASAAV